jgi:hypothetical protein
MSEQNQNDQNQSELSDETLENVAGGIVEGGCTDIKIGTPPYFPTND